MRHLAPATVLFSHLGLPGRTTRPPSAAVAHDRLTSLLQLAREPHVGVKVSGLYATSDPPHDYPHPQSQPYLECLLDSFGIERMYWGSDFSPCLNWISFAQAADMRFPVTLTSTEREQLMGANLRLLLDRAGRRPQQHA